LGEGLEVAGFIVGHAVVPAAPEDAQPFEGEAAEDGLVAFAGAFLLLVVRFAHADWGMVCPAHSTNDWRKNVGAFQQTDFKLASFEA